MECGSLFTLSNAEGLPLSYAPEAHPRPDIGLKQRQ